MATGDDSDLLVTDAAVFVDCFVYFSEEPVGKKSESFIQVCCDVVSRLSG